MLLVDSLRGSNVHGGQHHRESSISGVAVGIKGTKFKEHDRDRPQLRVFGTLYEIGIRQDLDCLLMDDRIHIYTPKDVRDFL